MVKKRIAAKLLIEDGLLVKYKRFTEQRRVAGDPVSTARTFEDQRVDEFILCDVGKINAKLVKEMTETVFCPVTAAGGIHSLWQVDELIRECGVDRVVVKDDVVGAQVAARYGKQAAVYPFNYHGTAPQVVVPEWAGEVLLTSIDRDGTGVGYDLDAVLRHTYKVPVTLSGGCGKLKHVKEAFDSGASCCTISSMFFFTDRSPIKLRSWLVSEGARVRAA